MSRRRTLYNFQKERIETLAVDAKSRRGSDPFVIIALDLTDDFAKQIAAAKSSPADVQKQIDHSNEKGVDPCVLLDTSYHDAGVFFENTQSWPQFLNTDVSDNQVAVAIVGDGGVSFCVHSIPQ